jgi:hypothetical protein
MELLFKLLLFKPLRDYAATKYYQRARSEIDPLHPDVGKVIIRCNELERGAS